MVDKFFSEVCSKPVDMRFYVADVCSKAWNGRSKREDRVYS